jgi:hypothetical protein
VSLATCCPRIRPWHSFRFSEIRSRRSGACMHVRRCLETAGGSVSERFSTVCDESYEGGSTVGRVLLQQLQQLQPSASLSDFPT